MSNGSSLLHLQRTNIHTVDMYRMEYLNIEFYSTQHDE